jgi:ferritin-like metal-binding protein YciE
MLLEKFDTPSELFTYKLGSALTMERDVLEMLGKLEQEAQSEELRQQFRHHAEEHASRSTTSSTRSRSWARSPMASRVR